MCPAPASTPAGAPVGYTPPADPNSQPFLSLWPGTDGPHFPVLLRNDFAAVIFALIVRRRCLCVALSPRRERGHGRVIVIAAYEAPRGSDWPPGPSPRLPVASVCSSPLSLPPTCLPRRRSQGGRVLPQVCRERWSEAHATTDSPQPEAGC